MTTKVIISDQFYNDVRKLRKRFPNILQDFQPLREQLERDERPGDRLQGLEQVVFKVRLKNADAQRGKSGGYRVIYYVETAQQVAMITIYSKSDKADIPIDLLIQFLKDYET
jgi:mRNA-degrading endonuclease RelE of RelBE toxin-antitoxin system